ncbi:hypothetical protein [Carboxylicivirga sp. N1Y90]|uniref:hypothetical protein n=1 Tax=Carboxylicivirga fragile TaxID=3417571 RepID=UPI003D35411D|nr:hypothetical protein [Marinilabiliaceae bacterium N1Y90]
MSVIINNERLIAGINWGAVAEKGWFAAVDYSPVDLDLWCFELDKNGKYVQILSFENKTNDWGRLSQDDMSGDLYGNDKEDNEWINFYLNKLPKGHKLCLSVINYTEQPINNLLHFDYRIYTGEANKVQTLFYFKDLKKKTFSNEVQGLFLGYIERDDYSLVFHNKEAPLYAKDIDYQKDEILDEILLQEV